MNTTMTRLVAAISVAAAALVPALAAAPAGAAGAACKGDTVKPRVHTEATRREATLASLVANLQARKDPYGMNGGQITALQQASSGISTLDQQIQSTCYPTLAALRTDATKLFVDYRVYWLRVPQTHAIQAADHLAEARARLGQVAAKLAGYVGSNTTAQADLAAMNQALAAADAKLGTPPTAGPSIAAVPGLLPAADMTAQTQALQAAHADLLAARASLSAARAGGAKVVADLRG
ncbi:MAG TPA: hypothetical protein VN636_03865 [Acidimicrobiia bacterium]|nr:hypothetical protein [Acidimicrobiia bacterium]